MGRGEKFCPFRGSDTPKVCSVDARVTEDSRMETPSNIAQLQPQSCLDVANIIRINIFHDIWKKDFVRQCAWRPQC